MSLSRRQFAAALATLSAAPSRAAAEEPESTFARVKRRGRLRLGAVPGAIPYSTKDLASGEWKGFCIDLGHDLASSLAVEVEWVETTWGNAVLDLQAMRTDAHFGLAPTPQRREAVDFSTPLLLNTNTVVARPGLDFKTWNDIDHPGITIAVDVGSSHDQVASRVLPHARLLRFDSVAAATLALQSGRADAQVLAILLSSALLARMPSIGHLVVPTPVETNPSCIGVRKQPDVRFVQALDAWIAQARAAGRVREAIVANLQSLAHVPATGLPPQIGF